MVVTSEAYKAAIRATVRKMKAKVEVVWQSADIDTTIVVSSNDSNYISLEHKQAANGRTAPTYKWFSLNYNLLDGAFHPMPTPGTNDALIYEVGFWNHTACSAGKTWSEPYPNLRVNFGGVEGRAVRQLDVWGDSIYNEYPVDFDIDIYNGEELLHHEEVRENALLHWTKDIASENINDATYMILTLGSWSTANRIAKIVEFYSSIAETYTDDILSLDILEEREISDGTLPVGNISANECDLKLQNINIGALRDPFTWGNTASYLATSLKPGRKITPYIGIQLPDTSIEYVKMGTFWSGDWKTSIKDSGVSTTALDRLGTLKKAVFRESLIYTSMTLKALAETILLDAKYNIPMLELAYSVADELEDYVVPLAYFPVQDYFKCLRQIAEACGGQVYMSRDDVVMVTGPSYFGAETDYSVVKNDAFDIQQPAKSGELKNRIQIPVSKLSVEANPVEAYSSDEFVNLGIDDEITLICDYNQHPVDAPTAEITDTEVEGIEITDEIYYATSAVITVKNNGVGAGGFKLKITGTGYNLNSDEIIEESDADSILEYSERLYQLQPNLLIQSRSMATLLAKALLASFKDYRKDVSLDWRGDPCLELGDVIEAPVYQRGAIDERANFLIFKNKLNFDGALRATTDGRKISDT